MHEPKENSEEEGGIHIGAPYYPAFPRQRVENSRQRRMRQTQVAPGTEWKQDEEEAMGCRGHMLTGSVLVLGAETGSQRDPDHWVSIPSRDYVQAWQMGDRRGQDDGERQKACCLLLLQDGGDVAYKDPIWGISRVLEFQTQIVRQTVNRSTRDLRHSVAHLSRHHAPSVRPSSPLLLRRTFVLAVPDIADCRAQKIDVIINHNRYPDPPAVYLACNIVSHLPAIHSFDIWDKHSARHYWSAYGVKEEGLYMTNPAGANTATFAIRSVFDTQPRAADTIAIGPAACIPSNVSTATDHAVDGVRVCSRASTGPASHPPDLAPLPLRELRTARKLPAVLVLLVHKLPRRSSLRGPSFCHRRTAGDDTSAPQHVLAARARNGEQGFFQVQHERITGEIIGRTSDVPSAVQSDELKERICGIQLALNVAHIFLEGLDTMHKQHVQ
ncbi:hypothetical protein DFH06DRAFT_1311728 [Mycena polygramma]|nr:hypothetical protein DFH06DRAFT_1311728 [Mycena polygramma]